MPLPELPQYQETMTALAAYLMVAGHKHPRSLSTDGSARNSNSQMRLLRRYAMALLACGVPHDAAEVAQVVRLFDLPFPRPDISVIDLGELVRLEAMIHLRPEDPSVAARLTQLLNQRQPDHTFLIPASAHHPAQTSIGNTLWVLRVLVAARRGRLLSPSLDDHALRRSLDELLPLFLRGGKLLRHDRDVALALRLYAELGGTFDHRHHTMLRLLLEKAHKTGGLWGMGAVSHAEDVIAAIHRGRLPSRSIAQVIMDEDDESPDPLATQAAMKALSNDENLRDIVAATCRVIENLAPLAAQHEGVAAVVDQSMSLWWQQFCGPNAPLTIHTIFSDEHDYLNILCLTVTAAHAYDGVTLKERAWLQSLRQHAEQFLDLSVEESLRTALQRWIDVEVGKPTPLELGLSGSNVVRIHPTITIPMLAEAYIPDFSLIVKYGATAEIDLERANYRQIPAETRQHFVRIPDKSYTDERGQTFVIMEDLNEYRTIFETYNWLLATNPLQAARKLAAFLKAVHKGRGGPPRQSTNKHLREIYIIPMLRESEQIIVAAEYIRRRGLPDRMDTSQFTDIDAVLQKLMVRVDTLGTFPLAFMHGDLHTRNIMVHKARNTPQWNAPHLFKLIDLEKLRPDGDAAHDAGQLLIDLQLLPWNSPINRESSIMVNLFKFAEHLEAAYIRFATERGDHHFRTRLELARVRAMIRIVKGRFKRALYHLDRREYLKTDEYVIETLGMIGTTREALRDILTQVKG